MKKIITLFSLLAVFNLLAIAGIVAFLAATGRLDKAKAQTIADVLKHKGTPDKFREQVYDIIAPAATTAPATGPATLPAPATPNVLATAEERIDFARKSMEQERLRLENEAQDLRHRQELLVQIQADVEFKLKKIEQEKKAYDDAVTKASSKGTDDSFQKTMALYDELKPKQIKDLFTSMSPDSVARYMDAMPPDRAAKIVGEFKTTEEKAALSAILDRMRSPGTDNAIPTRTATSDKR